MYTVIEMNDVYVKHICSNVSYEKAVVQAVHIMSDYLSQATSDKNNMAKDVSFDNLEADTGFCFTFTIDIDKTEILILEENRGEL